MPTTITQGFSKLAENLEITNLQENTVSDRQQNIRDAVKNKMTVLDSFLTGSYRRNTMIAPLSQADVDIFVILDPGYYSVNGYASLLDKVKGILQDAYKTTLNISRSGQAVTIVFTDFQVDIVPAFYRNGGGYLIPDTYGKQWLATDPKKHIELWSDANTKQGYLLKPLIKMLKCWNREHSRLLRSFHLETLAITVFSVPNIKIENYPNAAQTFFSLAPIWINFLSDPAGYGGNIGAYLDTQQKKDEVTNRMKTAYDKASDAIKLASSDKTKEAYDKWRILFGNYFPTYG